MLKQESGKAGVSPGAERFRVLLAAAVLPVLAGYTAVAALLAVVAALATQAEFSPEGVLLAAGPGWLAAHQVPISLGGQPLGLLPLGLSIGVALLLARSAAGAADRLSLRTPQEAVVLIATMAGAHAVVGVTVAVLANGSPVTADPLTAFCVPALFAAAAATAGVARPCGLLTAARAYTDAPAVAGIRAGMLGLAGMLAAGAAVLTVASVFAAPTMHSLFEASAPGFGSGFGMLLLCVGYLPNAVLAAMGVAAGPGFFLGEVWVSPVGFDGGSVPAMPLLAGLPDGQAGWWPVLFVLPAAVGVLVGWSLRGSSPDPFARLRSVGVAGAVVGFASVLLGVLGGGQLGSGSGVVLPLGFLSVAVFGWIALPAAGVVWFAGERPSTTPDLDTAADGESTAPDDGVLAGEDGVLAGEDGVLAGEDGVLAGEDGVLAGEDGVLAGEDGVLVDEVDVSPAEAETSVADDSEKADAEPVAQPADPKAADAEPADSTPADAVEADPKDPVEADPQEPVKPDPAKHDAPEG